jgi:hypothetical protein
MYALKRLETCGQSPWLDYLKRSFIESGGLRHCHPCDGGEMTRRFLSMRSRTGCDFNRAASHRRPLQAPNERPENAGVRRVKQQAPMKASLPIGPEMARV